MQTQQYKTVQLLSDEVHFYWLWLVKTSDPVGKEVSLTGQESKKVDLFIQEFKLEPSDGKLDVLASPCGKAVVVVKKEELPSSLSSPLPVRRSPTTPNAQRDSEGMFGEKWSINNYL